MRPGTLPKAEVPRLHCPLWPQCLLSGWGAGGAKLGKAAHEAIDAAKAAGHAPATFGHAVRVDYRKTFLEAHPELDGKMFVHHAVEKQAAKRYPDAAVTSAEMHSLENLRGIPNDINSELHLSKSLMFLTYVAAAAQARA